MTLVMILFIGIFIIGAAIFAMHTKDITSAVIATGVVSLMASVLFLVLAAPDVAMTEATIGAGLTTVVFLYALKQIDQTKKKSTGKE